MSAPDLARPKAEEADALVSQEERARLTSGVRLSVALMIMLTVIVAALTGLVFFLVSRAFDSMTPSIASDLEWKAMHGAVELSKTAELGLLVGDAEFVSKAATDYLGSSDVVSVVAMNADSQVVFHHGDARGEYEQAFEHAPQRVHSLGGALVAWAPAVIEGQQVGKVLVAVSTARLRAGDELRGQLFKAALAGGVVAVLLAFGFVVLYILPILSLTEAAFRRLEHTTRLALSAARLKAQFLANMSHEIRTPMNAVVGLSKLMLGMPLGPKVRRYAERIDTSSRSLLNIINDILDFSKLEAGKYRIYPTPCDASVVVQEVAEILAERAQAKGVDLVYRVAPDVPRVVEADVDRVRQVLTNLAGNAVKFTERGEVYIELSLASRVEENVVLRFEVRDSGIGIPEDQRDRVFESFSQADGSMVRQHGGTGLGLAISKQLVALMGGEIGLWSELRRGSTFWFTLPVKLVEGGAAEYVPPPSLGKRALIVCDNEHAAESLREHVVAWGMTVTVVADEPAAVAELRESVVVGPRFDLLLVSETQRKIHGASLVTALKRQFVEDLPSIVILSQLRADSTRNELDQEVAAQLSQPVRMSELYECLSRVLLGVGTSRAPAAQATVLGRDFDGARVLVVDDNEMNQFVASELLERLGCKVDQAFNGREAVDAVMSTPYALVLMDCQMPVMDGYSAAAEIRAREPAGRRTPIVALTAHALEGERERVLAAGMDDYLTKPVRPQTIQRALARWITHDGSPPSGPEPMREAAREEGAPRGERESGEELGNCTTALLEMFLDKVPMQLESLDGALAGEDTEEVRVQAHKLKGSLLAVAAYGLADLAHQLQLDGERRELSRSEVTHQELIEGFYRLEKQVRHEIYQRSRAAKGVSGA